MTGFDAYVRRVATLSIGLSILCVVIAFLFECGGLLAGVLAGFHVLLMVVLLGIPQLVHRARRRELAIEASDQALLAWLLLGASVAIVLFSDRGGGACFR